MSNWNLCIKTEYVLLKIRLCIVFKQQNFRTVHHFKSLGFLFVLKLKKGFLLCLCTASIGLKTATMDSAPSDFNLVTSDLLLTSDPSTLWLCRLRISKILSYMPPLIFPPYNLKLIVHPLLKNLEISTSWSEIHYHHRKELLQVFRRIKH